MMILYLTKSAERLEGDKKQSYLCIAFSSEMEKKLHNY